MASNRGWLTIRAVNPKQRTHLHRRRVRDTSPSNDHTAVRESRDEAVHFLQSLCLKYRNIPVGRFRLGLAYLEVRSWPSAIKSPFRQPDQHVMMVLNLGGEDFLPIGLPQPGDVGFEIVQGKPHVADHASPDIAQVGPVPSQRVGFGRHVAVRVVVIGD
jgi:hypothetical protein